MGEGVEGRRLQAARGFIGPFEGFTMKAPGSAGGLLLIEVNPRL